MFPLVIKINYLFITAKVKKMMTLINKNIVKFPKTQMKQINF